MTVDYITPDIERTYAPVKACAACSAMIPVDLYPLGRPRADGSRHPMRFCAECLAKRCVGGVVRPDEAAEINRQAKRASRFRRRRQRGHW